MAENSSGSRRLKAVGWAVTEVSGIIFLFYSNLLMGEFTAGKGVGKSLASALGDIFTGKNFAIAVVTAVFGFVVFESLRRKLSA
jgi:hypothetical protein